MKRVYVVIAGWDYEGHSPDTIKVFAGRTEADKYANQLLTEDMPYDHVNVLEQEVIEPEGKVSKGWSNAWPMMPTGH
jgi:hypothetical protein